MALVCSFLEEALSASRMNDSRKLDVPVMAYLIFNS